MRRRATRELEWLWSQSPNRPGTRFSESADYGGPNQVNINLADGVELVLIQPTASSAPSGTHAMYIFYPGGIYPEDMEPPPHMMLSNSTQQVRRVINSVTPLLGPPGSAVRGVATWNEGFSHSLSDNYADPARRVLAFDQFSNVSDNYDPRRQIPTQQ